MEDRKVFLEAYTQDSEPGVINISIKKGTSFAEVGEVLLMCINKMAETPDFSKDSHTIFKELEEIYNKSYIE